MGVDAMAFKRTVTTDIEAPLSRVYALVSDIRNHPQWAHNELTVQHTGGPETGYGAQYRSTVEHPAPGQRKPMVGAIRVVGAAPPNRFVYECHDDSGDFRWTIDLTSSPTGTTVHHSMERLGSSKLLRVIRPLAWEMIGEKQVVGGLAKLKTVAERPAITLPRQSTSSVTIELPTEVSHLS
jgi:uncharacterized protein YndB with AHSA1/START domain